MSATPDSPGLTNWILILLLGAVWGTAFMSMELALEGFGPVSVAAMRVAFGAPVLIIGGALTGQGLDRLDTRRVWLFAAASGVLSFALPFFFLSWGQQYVPSAVAGVAMGTVPLLLLPLVMIFSPEENVTWQKAAGLATGFVGLFVLVGGNIDSGSSDGMAFWGTLACTGTAASYAVGSIVMRRSPAVPAIAFAAASLLVASAIMVPTALVTEGLPETFAPGALAAAAYAAVFPTALAAFLRVHVIKTAGSLFMGTVAYMVPVWAVIFGVVILDEALPPELYMALALILSGIGISQWKTLRQVACAVVGR